MKCHDFLSKHCHSCELLSLDYSSSVRTKEEKLYGLFSDNLTSKEIIRPSSICKAGAAETRNKAKLAVSLVDGEIQFGFYDNGIQFKKLEQCPLHAGIINDVLVTIKTLLVKHKIIPYDVSTKFGELKYLLITYSKSSDELLIRFVVRSKESLDRLRKLSADLLLLWPGVKVVTANIQNIHQAILEGEEEIVLTEKDHITHHFDDYLLFQGPRSFFQTNTDMAKELYRQFELELSGLNVKKLLDLYCGVGAFSFYASKTCEKVLGIEISKDAIGYANLAKVHNQSAHLEFIAQDAEVFLNQQSEEHQHYDAIVVNPPRRGLNEQIIKQLMALDPKYIFYSSCNVETLYRDWKILEKKYHIKSLQLFDMFPYTEHFETLMILSAK
jgi:23S rRNA (uracil747-C5)-methyltransferase